MMGNIRINYWIILVILSGSLLIPFALAGNPTDPHVLDPNPAIAEINSTNLNDTALVSYHDTPESITVFQVKAEVTALPGPRYMAYGPSIIGVTIHPMIFSLIIVLGIAILALMIVRIYGKNRKQG